MLRVTLTTLIIGHIVWWPVWFILSRFVNDDGFIIGVAIAMVVGFGGTYNWLQSLKDNDSSHYWEEYSLIPGIGLLVLTGITAGTLAWVMGW